jgi:hypothetical protein
VSENERQQRMVERVQEDERLRGELPDDAATALVEWASRRVAAAAADPARSDAEVEAEVQAIRAAARAAARAGEEEPQRVVARANAALAQQLSKSTPPAQTSAATAPETSGPALPVATKTEAPAATRAAAKPHATQSAQAPPERLNRFDRRRSPFWRRWKSLASFWKRNRGGR